MLNKERLRETKRMLSNEKEKIKLLGELVMIKKLSLLMRIEFKNNYNHTVYAHKITKID